MTSDELALSQPARILLVDGDPSAVTLVREMLRSTWTEGLLITHAERLADAAQELLDHTAACVLIGISMTDADPLSPIGQIRTIAPDIAIIALIDYADEDMSLRIVKAGAQDCLVKSELNSSQLTRAVKYAIERKRSQAWLAHQALHDPLTGLPNRALFLDRLGVALDRSRRTAASVAVLFLDVDNFKQINDTQGHAVGDALLEALAGRLRRMLRPMDTVARFGGDEFIFLFEELSSEREVVLIAERLSRAAALPLEIEDGQASVTVSIGIAMVTDPSIPPETVIREADAAMYRAKELGRSRFELFDEASRQRAMERLELETALRHAIERSELRVHYQPKVTLGGETRVSGFEALVRWQHPERGLLGPLEFIPLAEEIGLIVPIGQYVLEHVLRALEQWRTTNPDVTISVNLSRKQLEDTGLVPMLATAIGTRRVDPSALVLELRESALLENGDATERVLSGLKALGVRIALDDYGDGPSSLTSLMDLPIDSLEIHHRFVTGLGTDARQAPVVGALVGLAHALGFRALAKRVETEAQLAELRTLGCDGAQGYLFGAPVPEAEAQAILAGS